MRRREFIRFVSGAAAARGRPRRAQEGDGVARASVDEQQFLLASLPPSRGQVRMALGISAALLVVFSITAPFASIQLPRFDSFVPAHQSVYAVNDLITSALLFSQFSIVRRWAVLVLAIGFLYSALIAIPLMLVFPGAFAPTGLLGAGVQTTPWLYYFWKFGLPLAVILYVLLKDTDGGASTSKRAPRITILWSRDCDRNCVRADLDRFRRGEISAESGA